jgi:hypothetical protein
MSLPVPSDDRQDGSVIARGYRPADVWGLDLEGAVPGRTWWWWFWLFFIRGGPEGAPPRQVMVMHTTRLASRLRVEGLDWRGAQPPRVEEGNPSDGSPTRARFTGLAAGWYFDGARMRHPMLLQSNEYTLSFGPGPEGSLIPEGRPDLEMHGDGARYLVGAADTAGETRMTFEATPWSPDLSAHENSRARFFAGWNYSITRVPAMKAHGEIRSAGGTTETVEATAYFQRVRVNAPTLPWYWGVVHADPGLYIDYFQANLGADMLRRGPAPRPRLDRSRIANLGRGTTLEVIDATRGAVHEFRDFAVHPRAREGAPSPDFVAEGESAQAKVRLALRPYAHACWRLEQRGRHFPFRHRLHYNEHPAELIEFEFLNRATGRRISLADLSNTAAECEHAWGTLP